MSKARPDIWFPLYIGDYLADTAHLSTEQSGAYLHLLMDSWKSGPLPSDSDVLRRITRLSEDAWSNAWPMLSGFFKPIDDRNLVQPRLEIERTAWGAKKTVTIARARRAAISRWEKEKSSDASSMPQAMLEQCPSPPPPPKDLKDSRQNSHFDSETLDVKRKEDSGNRSQDLEAVKRVFDYYLEKLGKSPKQYALTEKRMRKGLAALRVCRRRIGDGVSAEEALGAAVDGLLASKWHMGANPSGKLYIDWETYVVKDVETMEKRWQDGGYNPDVHA